MHALKTIIEICESTHERTDISPRKTMNNILTGLSLTLDGQIKVVASLSSVIVFSRNICRTLANSSPS